MYEDPNEPGISGSEAIGRRSRNVSRMNSEQIDSNTGSGSSLSYGSSRNSEELFEMIGEAFRRKCLPVWAAIAALVYFCWWGSFTGPAPTYSGFVPTCLTVCGGVLITSRTARSWLWFKMLQCVVIGVFFAAAWLAFSWFANGYRQQMLAKKPAVATSQKHGHTSHSTAAIHKK